jgi:hypothetical protein
VISLGVAINQDAAAFLNVGRPRRTVRAVRYVWPALFTVLLLGGCGPLTLPVVARLEAQDQAQIDHSWNNMLTPPARLDRELLLDTIVAFQLDQFGVDRLHMQSEKRFTGGTVTMDVYFDRRRPEVDAFWVTVRDRRGPLVRVERYSSKEVFAHAEELGALPFAVRGEPTTQPRTDEGAADRARRFARIVAATKPAAPAPP